MINGRTSPGPTAPSWLNVQRKNFTRPCWLLLRVQDESALLETYLPGPGQTLVDFWPLEHNLAEVQEEEYTSGLWLDLPPATSSSPGRSSFTFGCSWTRFGNGFKYRRSEKVRKFKLADPIKMEILKKMEHTKHFSRPQGHRS